MANVKKKPKVKPIPGAASTGLDLGTFTSTSYGPPWNAMNGTGTTAGGTDLRDGKKAYIVAVDPDVIRMGANLRITPNPFGNPGIVFKADDTGGAIKGKRIDFYDWRGRSRQMAWGSRKVRVTSTQESDGEGGFPKPGFGGAGELASDLNLNPMEAIAQALRDVFGPIVDVIKFLVKPESWVRMGKVVIGVVALLLGAIILIKAIFGFDPTNAVPVKKAVGAKKSSTAAKKSRNESAKRAGARQQSIERAKSEGESKRKERFFADVNKEKPPF